MTHGSSGPRRAARYVGEAAAALCRVLDPRGPGAAVVWSELEGHGDLLERWRNDRRTARALPVVATRLRDAGLLPTLSAPRRALAEAAIAWGQARAASIRGLTDALGRAATSSGARVLLCKAAALHGLVYADPASRPAGDVDAFVPGEDIGPLHAALLAEGFRQGAGNEARIEAFRRRGDASLADLEYAGPNDVQLEIKADPIAMGMPIARTKDLAERRRPSPSYAGLWIPAPEVMVLQQVFSLARRPRVDILAHAELAATLAGNTSSLDLAWMLSLLEGEGLDGIFRAVLEDLERLFPSSAPFGLRRRDRRPAGAVPRRMRAGLHGHPRTRAEPFLVWLSRGLSTRRRAELAHWLLRRAFPPEPLLLALAADPAASTTLRAARRLALRLTRRGAREESADGRGT